MATERNEVVTAINIDARGAAAGAAQAAQAMQSVTSAADMMVSAEEALEKSTRKTTDGVTKQASALDRIERYFLPAEAAATKFSRAQEQLNRVIDSGGTNAARAQKILDGLKANYDSMGATIDRTSEAIKNADLAIKNASALDRLERIYLPAEAAARKFSDSQKELNSIISLGGENAARAQKIIDVLKANYDSMGVAIDRASETMDSASQGLSRHLGGIRGVAQQAGYQIADLATQISMGQNAVQALAVQGGQLAGAFGPMGAVIGGVVTVVGAMAVAMGIGAKETDNAREASDRYKEALKKADEILKSEIDLLREKSIHQRADTQQTIESEKATKNKILTQLQLRKEMIEGMQMQQDFGLGDIQPPPITPYATQLEKIKADIEETSKSIGSLDQKLSGLQNRPDITRAIQESLSGVDTQISTLEKYGDQAERILSLNEKVQSFKDKLYGMGATEEEIQKASKLYEERLVALDKLTSSTEKLNSVTRDGSSILKKSQELEYRKLETLKAVNATMDERIQSLQDEQAMLGLSERDRAIRVEELRAEAEYKKAGIPLDMQRMDLLREEAGRLYDLKDAEDARKEAARKAESERQRANDAAIRQQERMVDSITQYGADKLTDTLMSKTSKGWKEMIKGMWTDFQSFLVRAAAEAALRPIAVSLVGGMTGGSGLFSLGTSVASAATTGSAGSAGSSGAGSLMGMGSLFSGGGSTMLRDAGNWIATSSFGRSIGLSTNSIGQSIDTAGVSLTGAGEALSGGLQYSPYGAIGSIGANLMGLGSKNPWINAGASLAGSIAGGAIGSSMGTILGMAGGPVGAILGGFLGTAIGGLFGGGGKKADGADTYLSILNGKAAISGSSSYRGGNLAQTNAMAAAYMDAVNRIGQVTGGKLTSSPVSSFGYVGKYNAFYANGVGEYKSSEDAVKAALDATLRNPAVWSGLSEDIQAAMRNSRGDINQLGQDIDFAMKYRNTLKQIAGDLDDVMSQAKAQADQMTAQYREMADKVSALGLDMDATNQSFDSGLRIMLGLKEAKPAMSDVEKAVALLKAQFEALKPLMDQFGISAAEAELGLQKKLNDLKIGFDQGIADQIKQIIDPIGYQMDILAKAQEQRVKDAQALGADLVEVERLNGLERMKLLEQQSSQIKDYLDKQLLGDTSTLTGSQKLAVAQSQFGSAINAARNGDATALGNITGLADTVLNSARSMYASTAQFAMIEAMVRSQLESVGRALNLPGFATGTLSAPSGMAWVGESGPELISFRGGEQVYPAGQSAMIGDGIRADNRASGRLLAELVAETRTLRQQNADLVDGQAKLNNRLNILLSKQAS